MIRFSTDDQGSGTFQYVRTAEYLTAWVVSVPVTLVYFALVSRTIPALYALALPVFLGLMAVTNVAHFPVINPQWVLTAVRTLRLKQHARARFRLGYFPLCVQRSFPVDSVRCVELSKQKYGRGMGFFYYFMTPVVTLYSLYVIVDGDGRYALATNEVKNGDLADEGRRLAEFLGVPFEDKS